MQSLLQTDDHDFIVNYKSNTPKQNYKNGNARKDDELNMELQRQQIYQFLDESKLLKKVNPKQKYEQDLQKDEENIEDQSQNDDSFDEDMILEQIKCCEDEEEMRQFIEIYELRCNIMNPNYKKLYLNLKKKTILLMKIVKKNLQENSNDSSSSISKEFAQKNQQLEYELERYKNLQQINSQKITNLNKKNANIEYKYEQVKYKLEKLENEYAVLNNTDISTIELKQLLSIEKKARDYLMQISKKKNEMIEQLQNKLKVQNDSHKSMCIICQEQPIDCLLQPCNHACCCYNCTQGLEQCPMDRQLFTNVKKIFLS